MSTPVAISDIAAMLTERIDGLCREILPNGVREGHEWRVGSTKGEPGRSMAVHIGGNKAGVWSDFSASGVGGDALELVAAVLFDGNKGEAIRWSRGWLGIGDDADPGALERARARAAAEAEKRRSEQDAAAEKRSQSAFRIWKSSRVLTPGDMVWRYLMGRGIDLALLPKVPRALRFHPELYCGEVKAKLPAMVAALSLPERAVCGVHRTWLAETADGVTKAQLATPRKVLGRKKGAVIRLWKGADGGTGPGSVAGAGPGSVAGSGETILCEGIEDGLTLVLAGVVYGPDRRVAAAVDVGNFQYAQLPPGDIALSADNDAEGSNAYQSLIDAVRRFAAEGRVVRVAHSPEGKDFNDLLQKGIQ